MEDQSGDTGGTRIGASRRQDSRAEAGRDAEPICEDRGRKPAVRRFCAGSLGRLGVSSPSAVGVLAAGRADATRENV